MNKEFQFEHRLGYRILRWVLLIALMSGILLSTTQIIIDAWRVSDELDQQADQTLALVRDAASQAVYSIDEDLAQQVVDGLFEQQAVRLASIVHPDDEALAQRSRPLLPADYRPLTDPIFFPERSYRVPLARGGDDPVVYGYLQVNYDTAFMAASWLERATLTFLSGIARAVVLAMVLFCVFHILLTRPLFRIIESLSRVNPDNPGDTLLELPRGHRNDELGLWVNATNNLLVAITENQEKQAEAEARVNRLSRYDKLTGLPNRELFLSMLGNSLEEHRRNGQALAVFCFGIDDFKGVNEQHGYHMGDQLLQTVADRLNCDGPNGPLMVARLGSDQFVVVEQHLRDGYQCAATSEWLLQKIAQPIRLAGRDVSITATIGIALFPDDAAHSEQLLQRSEQTMTLAKTAGRNQFQFYVASVDQEIRDRKKLEKDLQMALVAGQFHLVYQPQINLETRRVIGAEALLRWEHPEHGLVPPDQFIPLAEISGSIVDIGLWVLDQACAQAAEWTRAGMPIRIAVNLSAVQLQQADIVETILSTLKRHAIPPGRLELEVTETGFMENLDSAIEKLTRLRSEGINIAVDDFGTGYSSLTYIKRLPLQHLKIDKQFVHDLLVNEEDTRIANTIIDLGKSLNLDVIAEGVETEEQEFYLHNRGCQLAQGYFFSKPLKPADFAVFVADFHQRITANSIEH
ncbi:EAL domain-containing protein [Marinobacter nanhaiticus D15-8W]|uniref:cyclic-guanylate-specific phosphodiesterase n=1 Tax=Marinobacter nanhaiticus D15-8W TaxID=626887 RepID=N6X777_9GAMM|nr:bifunctional diguanylate cyclase/phosphodiesterase [Marinobacter nanhaiticus]ENO16993.1 EAL domain-containing protein [Marinobacter nanhaiticus D15-8W]